MQACLLIGFLGLAYGAAAQPTVPLTGRRTADFVPAGWVLERKLGGDLNADQRPDSVLVVIEQPEIGRAIKDESGLAHNRALVVLLTQPDGTLLRVGVGANALLCDQCFWQQDYTETGTPAITIRQGAILVRHSTGAGQVLTQTQHYRYERPTGRIRLVREDYNRLDRPDARFVGTATDLLTGRQLVRRGKSEQAAQIGKPAIRTGQVPPLYLEDVNLPDHLPTWLPPDFFD